MICCVLPELSTLPLPLLLLLTGHHFMSQTDHQTNCCLVTSVALLAGCHGQAGDGDN